MKFKSLGKLCFVLLMLFLVSHAVYAAPSAPEAPAEITLFEISPSESQPGDSVNITINAELTSSDGTTYFCLYIPDTVSTGTTNGNANNTPSSINMVYYVGFNSFPITFNKTNDPDGGTSCPARSGQTSTLYRADGLPTGTTTYETVGTNSMTLSATATPGTYSWTVLVEEPSGQPNVLSDNHTILEPLAVALQNVSVVESTTGVWMLLIVACLAAGVTAFLLWRIRRPIS